MKVLFICRANRIRSRGAEAWFSKKFPQHEFKSCGTDKIWVDLAKEVFSDAQVLSLNLINWADKLVFMERMNQRDAIKKFGPDVIGDKINEVWGLPDEYDSWDDPRLIKTFEYFNLDDFFNDDKKTS